MTYEDARTLIDELEEICHTGVYTGTNGRMAIW